jgi:prefoldin subunit 5
MTHDWAYMMKTIDEEIRHKTAEKAYVKQQLRKIKQEIKDLRRTKRSIEASA